MLPIRYYGTVVCPGVARGTEPIAPLADDLSPLTSPNRETSLVPCRGPRGELAMLPSFSSREIYLSALDG